MAEMLRREYGQAALTMGPEWTDIRGFLWDGWRAHVRYTHQGRYPRIDKRVQLKTPPDWEWVNVAAGDENWWYHDRLQHEDTTVDVLRDIHSFYYWRANEGGSWHAEAIDEIMRVAKPKNIDLVGCNSPRRALFKHAFGLPAVPYYFVTTGDPASVEEFWGERRPVAA